MFISDSSTTADPMLTGTKGGIIASMTGVVKTGRMGGQTSRLGVLLVIPGVYAFLVHGLTR
jgi:hypothetical protein